MTHADQEHRGRQIAVGVGILLAVTGLVCGTLIGWRYLPGLMGEWIGTMVGVATTPFFMEGSFVVLGLTVVVAINHWRQKRDGDELVYLEQSDEPDPTAGVPGPSIMHGNATAAEDLARETKPVGVNLDK